MVPGYLVYPLTRCAPTPQRTNMTISTRRRLTILALAVSAVFAGAALAREAHARTQTAPTAPPATVKVFLVALGDDGKSGKRIGCDDSLVAVSRPLAPGAA